MSDRSVRTSGILTTCVVGGLAVLLVLGLCALLLRPYLETRRLVQQRLNQGRPIVQAVYEFERSNGRWPNTIDDLVPAYLPGLPPDGNWSYAIVENGPPVVAGDATQGKRLIYGFPPLKAALLPPGIDHGWILDGRNGESFVASD